MPPLALSSLPLSQPWWQELAAGRSGLPALTEVEPNRWATLEAAARLAQQSDGEKEGGGVRESQEMLMRTLRSAEVSTLIDQHLFASAVTMGQYMVASAGGMQAPPAVLILYAKALVGAKEWRQAVEVFEQALLPPNAVLTLLPSLLGVLLAAVPKKSDEQRNDDVSSERLFRAVTGVLQKLNTSGKTLLTCLEVVQDNGKAALSSPARMECVHTLLQKGTIIVGQDVSVEIRAAWGKAEGEFMALLQSC